MHRVADRQEAHKPEAEEEQELERQSCDLKEIAGSRHADKAIDRQQDFQRDRERDPQRRIGGRWSRSGAASW